MKNTNKKGFTIVELVIVIAVIAILAAVLIPTFSGIIEKANISSAEQAARNAYTQYVAENAASGKFEEKVVVKTSDGYYVFLNNGSVVNTKVGEIEFKTVDEDGFNKVFNKATGKLLVHRNRKVVTETDTETITNVLFDAYVVYVSTEKQAPATALEDEADYYVCVEIDNNTLKLSKAGSEELVKLGETKVTKSK